MSDVLLIIIDFSKLKLHWGTLQWLPGDRELHYCHCDRGQCWAEISRDSVAVLWDFLQLSPKTPFIGRVSVTAISVVAGVHKMLEYTRSAQQNCGEMFRWHNVTLWSWMMKWNHVIRNDGAPELPPHPDGDGSQWERRRTVFWPPSSPPLAVPDLLTLKLLSYSYTSSSVFFTPLIHFLNLVLSLRPLPVCSFISTSWPFVEVLPHPDLSSPSIPSPHCPPLLIPWI